MHGAGPSSRGVVRVFGRRGDAPAEWGGWGGHVQSGWLVGVCAAPARIHILHCARAGRAWKALERCQMRRGAGRVSATGLLRWRVACTASPVGHRIALEGAGRRERTWAHIQAQPVQAVRERRAPSTGRRRAGGDGVVHARGCERERPPRTKLGAVRWSWPSRYTPSAARV
ncbi:hypothetical protein BC834DRAFT_631978 [Gloeopeniophorella convolvens]|nr:hypothetical protein BC834DRAFT_631978 [Gloeopeniophorella convolvens]